MKYISIVLILFGQLLFAQKQVNSIDELDNKILRTSLRIVPGMELEDNQTTFYFDKNMKLTNKSNAYYRLEKKFHSHNYVIKSMPTYDEGHVLQADQQKLKNYSLTAFYPNGNEAFTFLALHADSLPKVYYLQGDAIWYREDGTLLAKSQFDSGQLKGDYVEYDEFGEETKKAMFNNSEVVNMNTFNTTDNQYMVGDWVQDQGSWLLDIKQGEDLHNEYLPDGTLKIYMCYYSLSEGETQPDEVLCDDALLANYKYIPKSQNQGIVEIYVNGELTEKEAITFINSNEYKSKTVYFKDNPSMVGTSFHFKKK